MTVAGRLLWKRLGVMWTPCVLFVMILPACGKSDDPAGSAHSDADSGAETEVTVTSDDGSATLVIPAGALPKGVNASDIEVTAIAEADLVDGASDPDWRLLGAYDLAPDGISFSKPATLTVAIDKPLDGFVFSGSLSAKGPEYLLPTLTNHGSTVDGVGVSIKHFSTVFVWDFSGWRADPKLAKIPTVQPLTATIPHGPTAMTVTVLPSMSGSFNHGRFIRWVGKTSKSYTASVTWNTKKFELSEGMFFNYSEDEDFPLDGDLTPMNPSAPPDTKSYSTTFASLHQLFRCKKVGQMEARYQGIITLEDAEVTWTEVETQTQTKEPAKVRNFIPGMTSMAPCNEGNQDGNADYLDSVKKNTPTYTGDAIDIRASTASKTDYNQEQVDALCNNEDATLACAQTTLDDYSTVCPEAPEPVDPGSLFAFTMVLATDVPLADTDHSFIYSVVLDSDDAAANNWVFVSPYDWDLFQGTDRWYQLVWDHLKQVWSLSVTQVDDQQQTTDVPSSAARAVISGRSVTFYIPEAEIPATNPGYRLTAFGHDGNYSVSDRGADVTGADPTKPLTKVE